MVFVSDKQRKKVMMLLKAGRPFQVVKFVEPTKKPSIKVIQLSDQSHFRTGSTRYGIRDDLFSFNRFNLEQLRKIGSGRDRTVYELPDGKLIKIAKNPNGLLQNDQAGGNAFMEGYLPEVYETGKDYVVVEKVLRDDKRSRKLLKPLQEFFQPGFDVKEAKLQDAFRQIEEEVDAPDASFDDFMNFDLSFGDFKRASSWGWRGNQPVLIDEGALSQESIKKLQAFGEPRTDLPKRDWQDVLNARRVARHNNYTVITNGKN